jgi:hypothetical protein
MDLPLQLEPAKPTCKHRWTSGNPSPELTQWQALQAQLTALTGPEQRQDRRSSSGGGGRRRRRPPGITPSTSAMSVASLGHIAATCPNRPASSLT